jgi:chemotaxis protein methyltransferase CheR
LNMPVEITTETFDRIRKIVHDQSGIYLNEKKDALVKARVSKRMRLLGLVDYDDYLKCIINDKSGFEIQQLLDAIATNTTGFYREKEHFDLIRTIVTDWINEGSCKLRVWSAAASTGEEPYTLVMELSEIIGAKMFDLKILATDIASNALLIAQRGKYDEEAVAPIPEKLLAKYFVGKMDKNKRIYTVKTDLREKILFRQFNLSKPPLPLKRQLDIIMCRNVMIYFDRDLRNKLAQEFERLLRPGGYLFVGHSESLNGTDSRLRCVKPSVYIKD